MLKSRNNVNFRPVIFLLVGVAVASQVAGDAQARASDNGEPQLSAHAEQESVQYNGPWRFDRTARNCTRWCWHDYEDCRPYFDDEDVMICVDVLEECWNDCASGRWLPGGGHSGGSNGPSGAL